MTKTITVKIDRSCQMASVWVDDGCVMVGNYWDFYPGCHGIYEYGEFNGPDSLARAVAQTLRSRGEAVVVEYKQFTFE